MTLALYFVVTSQAFSLPVGLLSALCYVESAHTPSAVHFDDGGSTSNGVCQIKLNTARMIGFKGTAKQLMNPKTNIHWSGKYLKRQLDRYDGIPVKAIAAYNAGKYRVNKAGLIMNRKYVKKVLTAWAARK